MDSAQFSWGSSPLPGASWYTWPLSKAEKFQRCFELFGRELSELEDQVATNGNEILEVSDPDSFIPNTVAVEPMKEAVAAHLGVDPDAIVITGAVNAEVARKSSIARTEARQCEVKTNITYHVVFSSGESTTDEVEPHLANSVQVANAPVLVTEELSSNLAIMACGGAGRLPRVEIADQASQKNALKNARRKLQEITLVKERLLAGKVLWDELPEQQQMKIKRFGELRKKVHGDAEELALWPLLVETYQRISVLHKMQDVPAQALPGFGKDVKKSLPAQAGRRMAQKMRRISTPSKQELP